MLVAAVVILVTEVRKAEERLAYYVSMRERVEQPEERARYWKESVRDARATKEAAMKFAVATFAVVLAFGNVSTWTTEDEASAVAVMRMLTWAWLELRPR